MIGITIYLVGGDWNHGMDYDFPYLYIYIGNVIIPTDFHIFQRGGSTTNQLITNYSEWKL